MTAELVIRTAAELAGTTGFRFSEFTARSFTDDLRRDLASIDERLAFGRAHGVHTALGYAAWHDYVLGEFGRISDLRIRAEERRALVESMTLGGLSAREIRDESDWSLDTITRDRQALGLSPARKRPEVVVLPAPTGRTWEQAVEWLTRAGEKGLTRLELADRAKWSEGKAGGALADAQRRHGRAVRAEAWRDGQRVWLAVPPAE